MVPETGWKRSPSQLECASVAGRSHSAGQPGSGPSAAEWTFRGLRAVVGEACHEPCRHGADSEQWTFIPYRKCTTNSVYYIDKNYRNTSTRACSYSSLARLFAVGIARPRLEFREVWVWTPAYPDRIAGSCQPGWARPHPGRNCGMGKAEAGHGLVRKPARFQIIFSPVLSEVVTLTVNVQAGSEASASSRAGRAGSHTR